jgi:hypothetical protein
MGVEQFSSGCRENQAFQWLGETGRKLKLRVLPREKLISNSQAVSGRSWLILIYQSLTEPLLRNCLL